jgi:molecular chaperone GrpE
VTPYPESDAWPGGEQPPGRGDPEPQASAEDAVEAEVVEEVPESVAPEVGETSDENGDVVEGEIVAPAGSDEALADALLAEALDEDAIEAQFTAAEAEAQSAAKGATAAQVAALTTDLQRVHAEYSNYRKRVERDRSLMRDKAVEDTLIGFLPILDDIDRAREHGDLVGGFKAVAEALEGLVARKGMARFGEPGEVFDPTRHEALMREEREGVTEPTVVTVLQVGYEMNGRIVRPARVSVAGAL